MKRLQCTTCQCWLNTKQYDKTPTGRLKKECRSCGKKNNYYRTLQGKYGITAGEYNLLLSHQEGACYICQRKPRKRMLAVDHCHDTGNVRGLLCTYCNRYVLGHLKDDVTALQRAIVYLTVPPAHYILGSKGEE